MTARTPFRHLIHIALAGVFLAAVPHLAAQAKFDVDDPKFDDLQSPEVGGNTGKKNWDPKDWLEVEVKFKIDAVRPDAKFVDEVRIRWYVAVENPESKGYWLLEKEVTHVNVPVGEDIYASVYLSPTSVMRLSGGERASKAVVDRVGGEISILGTTNYFSSKGKAGWWQSGTLSRSDKVPLLNKNQTPFKMLWYDRYAEIQERR
ncbi:MAG: hypothetical protein HKN82_10995 [Akkermansiaceae bacterium]|nr:hypothetical protein [Akkermansiaceae bacterium]NNM30956.1 hypothetical protein [Akkermansiaceae bacterium]